MCTCTKGLPTQTNIKRQQHLNTFFHSCSKYIWWECTPRLHSQRFSVTDLFFLSEVSSQKEFTYILRQKSKAFEFAFQIQPGPSSQLQHPVPQCVKVKKYSPNFQKRERKANQAQSGLPSSSIQACWPVQEARNTSHFCQQSQHPIS